MESDQVKFFWHGALKDRVHLHFHPQDFVSASWRKRSWLSRIPKRYISISSFTLPDYYIWWLHKCHHGQLWRIFTISVDGFQLCFIGIGTECHIMDNHMCKQWIAIITSSFPFHQYNFLCQEICLIALKTLQNINTQSNFEIINGPEENDKWMW